MRCVPPDTLHHSAFTACTEFLPVHQSLWSWSPAHSWLLREIVLTCSQPQPSHLAGRRSLYKSDGRRGHSHLSNCADLLASSLPVPPPCLQERQPFLSPPEPWSFTPRYAFCSSPVHRTPRLLQPSHCCPGCASSHLRRGYYCVITVTPSHTALHAHRSIIRVHNTIVNMFSTSAFSKLHFC